MIRICSEKENIIQKDTEWQRSQDVVWQSRDVFKTQSNINDEVFLRRWLTAKICQLFSQKFHRRCSTGF